jgi:hypothetical protein
MKAYPYMHKHPTSGQTEIAAGMDLRDWFAGMAMQSILVGIDCGPNDVANVVESAYILADAMMKQRKEVSE